MKMSAQPLNRDEFYSGIAKKAKAAPLHAMEMLEGRGSVAATHSGPRH
jgi:hypothetical protein